MKDRIFKLMKWAGMNLSQFADALQVSPALLSSVKSERTKPTLLLVENIKKVYPNIDINWLITGEGEMLVGEEVKPEPVVVVPAPEQREVVSVEIPAEKEVPSQNNVVEPAKTPTDNRQVRAVKQVLLMYNDGTYESFEK